MQIPSHHKTLGFVSALLLGAFSTTTVLAEHSVGEFKNKTAYLQELAPLSKVFSSGDKGPEVKKIEEWLMLWQFNEYFVSRKLTLIPDEVFDDDTTAMVKEVQTFLEIPVNGVVDGPTWVALTSPMSKAFDLNHYNKNTMSERMSYFGTRHVQYHAAELESNNLGPWIRAYMDDHEGEWYYWCAGFVSTILDQSFSSVGLDFTKHYANSWLVEDHRDAARKNGLLVTNPELQSGSYVPKAGDMVVYVSSKDHHGHHIEIVLEVLDETDGTMRTIGGNTNFSGSSNGVGTFLVDRNFKDKDIEIIKLISDAEAAQAQANSAHTGPKDKLIASYPDQITGISDNKVMFASGKSAIYDDGKKKTINQMLTNSDVKNQFYFPYTKGKMTTPPGYKIDPGRITSQDFFTGMYGSTKDEVESQLEEFIWAPNFGGQKLKATRVNGVVDKLKAIGEKLDDDPSLKPFITNIGGTYLWRKVAGTDRLSLHSFGIAIDITVAKSSYWEWDCKCKSEDAKVRPFKNQIPQKIIDAFEEQGFIWGGKWYHYDTMHFEYRPEMLN